MAVVKTVQDKVHALIRERFSPQPGQPRTPLRPDPEWRKVRETGTQLWLDTGDIDEARKLLSAEFEALTTNNTLLNKEVQKGMYDDLVGQAATAIRDAAPDLDDDELLLEIAFVLNASHGLRLVEEFDVNVSVELHTDLANDVERSVEYGRRYYAICPERFIIKIPLTPAGYLSARRLRAEGIPINFTLGFSARHNYVAARLANPNYVNVFMGRLNAFVADNQLGSGDNVGEKATLATQRMLLELRDAGKTASQLIGASMRQGSQVATLAGLDVFTMPTKVAEEYRGNPAATLTSQVSSDPDIPLADGVTFDQFNATTLWETPEAFKECAEAIMSKNLDNLTPKDVQDHFAAGGFGDFLPNWSEADIQTATKEGKIPVLATWKDRLQAGEVGLDTLFNLSALYSFATDQKALDDRVRSLI